MVQRNFFCEFKKQEVSAVGLRDGSEICLVPVLCECNGCNCTLLKNYHNLTPEKISQISIMGMASAMASTTSYGNKGPF